MLGSDIQYKNVLSNVFGDFSAFDVNSFIVYVKLNISIIIITLANHSYRCTHTLI